MTQCWGQPRGLGLGEPGLPLSCPAPALGSLRSLGRGSKPSSHTTLPSCGYGHFVTMRLALLTGNSKLPSFTEGGSRRCLEPPAL